MSNENTAENQTPNNEESTEKKAPVKLDIINGRMPLAIVYCIRFLEDSEVKDGDLATKYKTSNGKISDIRKNRNFGYVTEGMNFSTADIEAANGYLEKTTLNGNTFTDDEKNSISTFVDSLPTSEDAAAAITEARKAARKSKPAAKGDETSETGSAPVEGTEATASDELDAAI